MPRSMYNHAANPADQAKTYLEPDSDFGCRNVLLYLKSDPKKAQVVVYKDIKNYKLIRQGGSLRLLLAGNWVTHPSGYQLVDINRPFMKDSLDGLAAQIKDVMREHRVNECS